MNGSLRRRTVSFMVCIGAYSTLAQVLLMREMLVVFFGNELTLAVILAAWLLGIGGGAALARWIVDRLSLGAMRWTLSLLGVALGVLLSMQFIAVRRLPEFAGITFGQYASLGVILCSVVGICVPVCLVLGFAFPAACCVLNRISSTDGGDPVDVTHIYTAEACGSMVAGLILTFVILSWLPPFGVMMCGVGLAAMAFGLMLPLRGGVGVGISLIVILTVTGANTPIARRIQDAADQLRWKSFGVLADSPEQHGVQLMCSEDSLYQNLAVTRLEDQYTLYGNGEVLMTFPDPYEDEYAIHFIMAQNPNANRVLILGAVTPGAIAELLKYPVQRLVCVELDRAVFDVPAEIQPAMFQKVLSNSTVEMVFADGVRYLTRCCETFDMVIVSASAPTTASANRYFTDSFFRNVARVLAPGGLMSTSLPVSERLMDDAAVLGGSVYQTMTNVFDKVLVTAESEPRLFAGGEDAPLTFERQTLFARSRDAGIEMTYFRPEYFLVDDAISPEKCAYVRSRFQIAQAVTNSSLQPVSYYNSMVLWSLFSSSGMTGLLRHLRGLRVAPLIVEVLVFGFAVLLVSVGIRWSGKGGSGWGRSMLLMMIASTGACGMALEVLLIFVFQSMYGYVYARIGLIVGLFMLGLLLGALSGRRLALRGHRITLLALMGIETGLLLFACLLPLIMRLASCVGIVANAAWAGEGLIFLCVMGVGWAVGGEFPLANAVLHHDGASVSVAAAVTDASDHLGAALGAFVVGVLLLPVLGIAGTGMLLAALKAAMIMSLAGAGLTLRSTRRG